jgi:putative phosphoesterase
LRVALLADVHGNLHALESVLSDAAAAGCDTVWMAGDWVGYGAFPEECVRRLRAAGAEAVVGDMDREVLRAAEGSLPGDAPAEKRAALRHAAAALSDESLAYLGSLPESRRLTAASLTALLVHGSPERIDERLRRDGADERLAELARRAGTRLVVCGHTHAAMEREVACTRFLNPGSVGRPGDGDPRAAWAELRLERGEARFAPRRLAYDHLAAAEAVRRAGLPAAVARMLEAGRSLKSVLAGGAKG